MTFMNNIKSNKAVFEEAGLAAFLAHIGVEDEEKAKSAVTFQNSDSALLDHWLSGCTQSS